MQWPSPAVPYGMLQKMSTLPQGSKRLEVSASMPRAPHFPSFPVLLCCSYLAALRPLAQSDWKPSTGKQMPISSVSTSLIFLQPPLSFKNYRSTGHVATAPTTAALTAQSENPHQTGLQTEEAAHRKEADYKAMTTTWHHHRRDLLLILGYTSMTTHSTSCTHTVLSCSALNSAHQQTLPPQSLKKQKHFKIKWLFA